MGGNSKESNFHEDDSELSIDCVFKGKQTSFWDMWGDHQDNKEEGKV